MKLAPTINTELWFRTLGDPGACTSDKLHPLFPGAITCPRRAEPGCGVCQLLPTERTRNALQARAAFPSPLGREERCPWGYSAASWAFRAWISLISGQACSEMSLLQPGHFYSRNGHHGFSFPELLMDYIRVINKAFCLGRDSGYILSLDISKICSSFFHNMTT